MRDTPSSDSGTAFVSARPVSYAGPAPPIPSSDDSASPGGGACGTPSSPPTTPGIVIRDWPAMIWCSRSPTPTGEISSKPRSAPSVANRLSSGGAYAGSMTET